MNKTKVIKLSSTCYKKGHGKGDKNVNWKGGPPQCVCGKVHKDYHKGLCVDCYRKKNRGENHYKWKGGTGQPYRRTGEYKNWRKAVYSRDYFTCQMPSCGYKGPNIEAHHIIPCRENAQLVNAVNNGITLCKDCHKLTRYKEDFYQSLFTLLLGRYYDIMRKDTAGTGTKGAQVLLTFQLP
jgi:hypothetical protein